MFYLSTYMVSNFSIQSSTIWYVIMYVYTNTMYLAQESLYPTSETHFT